MSTRAQKIRRIYCELRQALGTEPTAVELLRLAHLLVADPVEEDVYMTQAWRPRFEQLPLDQAFADGGWRVLESEKRWVKEKYIDEEINFNVRIAA